MTGTVDSILGQRLATQRLTSPGHLHPADVVRDLVCMQSQDAPLARFSIGMRLSTGDENMVRAAIVDHQIVRTHILRTTWHYVAAADLRWILAFTSPRVIQSMQGRWARLSLDAATFGRAQSVLTEILNGQCSLTRSQIRAQFTDRGLPGKGEAFSHLIMRAELTGLICGAGLSGDQHTYGLLDELVPASAPRDRDEAMREFVGRFIAGHGPATDRDIARYASLTLTDIRRTLAELANALVSTVVDGQTLWSDPTLLPNPAANRRAFLLPTFDEAFLAFVEPNFPRTVDHPRGTNPPSFAEAAGGLIVLDRTDIGHWRRKLASDAVVITLQCAESVDAEDRVEIERAAHRLAMFIGRPADVM